MSSNQSAEDNSESESIIDFIESIDFDKAWDDALAQLEAEGVDTRELLQNAADNLRRWRSALPEE